MPFTAALETIRSTFLSGALMVSVTDLRVAGELLNRRAWRASEVRMMEDMFIGFVVAIEKLW
jgi:hypothetical protein